MPRNSPVFYQNQTHTSHSQCNPKKHGVWDPMPELTITSRYIHSRVDSNKLTMRFGQPFSSADLTPMAESTFSPSQGLWFFGFGLSTTPTSVPPPPHAKPLYPRTIQRATSGSFSSASVIKKRRTSRDEDRRRDQEGLFAISL